MNTDEPVPAPEAGVRTSVDGAVATVLLDRPEVRNAQNPAMWAAIADFLESLTDEVRVVVVRGAGGTFSAGLDLALVDPREANTPGSLVETLARSDEEVIDLIGEYQRPFVALADPRFISIAVVEGYAIGAGFQMALGCDLRIMAEDAWVCMKEPALGLVPDLAGTKPLVAAVGYARALEICATARKVGAHEAERIGLAQSVVPAADLDSTLEGLVGSLTAHDATAVRRTHELLAGASARSLDEQRLAERTAQVGQLRAVLRG
ncbi:enoyl-CoA hydratase/carnithine racemase [Nocardioides luteus]|uniref:Enoyl-CoA hydratase n=1 Tax=Nocardioides luteus TaxID=1844 RepID=A0ABQ5SVA7_9ACTN|nr:enoyl-CoA hydratase/isomerase family protein [Nocardioides luteus]MDR7311884.1 enoyl-CoA hydratase/carnithine racemase [Nocardioides luteus]GGR67005.1 enoyl-CoA hydratase [Nocardioides luteus]GLJ68127.1 enoyl-CoA hydratase [Nocardioides luteus]